MLSGEGNDSNTNTSLTHPCTIKTQEFEQEHNLKDHTSNLRSKLSGIQIQISRMRMCEQSSRISHILAERGFVAEDVYYVDENVYDEEVDENFDTSELEYNLPINETEHEHQIRNPILAECAERETLINIYRSNEKELNRLYRENQKLLHQVQMMRAF